MPASSTADTRRNRIDGLALSIILVCCALWGLNQVVVKATLPAVPPLLQGGLRSALAAALLWVFATRRGITLLARDGTGWPGIAAGVLFGLEFCCVYTALQYTSASRLVVFLYLAPFVVAIGMPFISRSERLSRAQVLGLSAAFASVAFAFHEGLSESVPGQWLGDALAILSGILWGATTLVVRATRLTSATPERTLFYQLAVSAPVMLGGSLAAGESMAWPPHGLALASLFFQAVVVAFASYLGWFWLLRHYPATRVSSFTFLTPVFGLAFGALLLGEALTPGLLLALAGVATGIWLVNRR
ncbi:MAG TPA: DMT family transporter [Quisquiliibacterium sp.]|nr:DMT family transporter [Quisquiliibacterium sp.]